MSLWFCERSSPPGLSMGDWLSFVDDEVEECRLLMLATLSVDRRCRVRLDIGELMGRCTGKRGVVFGEVFGNDED